MTWLLADQGYDMVIGARSSGSHANVGRLYANGIYNVIASWLTGRRIPDLTSGFRVARANLFKRFLYLLPNGFSYPTTITMAFLRAGFPIRFEPIPVAKRIGKSHIRPVRDGIRFMVIIFKIATLYSPLKIFAQDFPADQRIVLRVRSGLVCIHVFDDGAVYEHEHAIVQRVGHRVSDRADL
jgi:hypothetical protein